MQRMVSQTLLIFVLAGVTFAQTHAKDPSLPNAPSALPTKDTVDSFMKHWFGYDSSITWQIAQIQPADVPGMSEVTLAMDKNGQKQIMELYVTADQKHAFTSEAIPFGADPFAPARQQLAASTTGIVRGPANAALAIVEFSDLQCPHCKDAQPVMDKLMADYPNARIVFQQFPLEMHPWAFKAASWGQCIGKENSAAFWKFAQSVYGEQLTIDAQNADTKLRDLAAAAGGDPAKASACVASPETAQEIHKSLDLGKAVGVSGTPTFFVNGRKVMGITSIPYETLKELVNFSEKGPPTLGQSPK